MPYEIKFVDITKDGQFKLQFLAISPSNRMPAIVNRGGPGGKPPSAFESSAILQYLATDEAAQKILFGETAKRRHPA